MHFFYKILCYGPSNLLSRDIDECATGNAHGCGPTQMCFNTIGSYTCGCGSGFSVSKNDTNVCVDLDECKDNPCQNSKECINTERF